MIDRETKDKAAYIIAVTCPFGFVIRKQPALSFWICNPEAVSWGFQIPGIPSGGLQIRRDVETWKQAMRMNVTE